MKRSLWKKSCILALAFLFIAALSGCPFCHHPPDPGEGEGEGEGEPGEGEGEGEGEPVQVPTEVLTSGLTAELVDQSPYDLGLLGGPQVSIAVDGAGDVHLAYRNAVYQLNYAKRTAGGWLIVPTINFPMLGGEISDFSTVYGGSNSLALDALGNVHISCSENDGADEDLYYLTNAAGYWQAYQADCIGFTSVGLSNSIAVDAAGAAHISHLYWNQADLLYSSNAGGNWETAALDTGSIEAATAIGIDAGGVIYIAYNDASNAVWLQSKAGGIWSKEQVPISALPDWNPDRPCALAFDGSSNLYLLGLDGVNIKRGATWEHQAVFTGLFGSGADYYIGLTRGSLALDAQGNMHICFYYQPIAWSASVGPCDVSTDFAMYYANNVGGTWQAWVIDNWPVVTCDQLSSPPRLALDSSGKVHYAYNKSSDWKVRYLAFDPASL